MVLRRHRMSRKSSSGDPTFFFAPAAFASAFARFQALSREAREIEARAREAKLDDVQEDDAGGLVA